MSLEGQQFGEFQILERLGQGGMGAVYKARQVSLKRTVALKTLQAGIADDAEYIERFHQEAEAAAGLNHPNLVQVHSAGEHEGLHWFAMEYVDGESVKGRLKRKGRLKPLEAIAIVTHVATALEYGWRKAGLIHRDIKPDNIFLSKDGEVKLGDLGLAKSAGQTTNLTLTGHSMGTPHYISPEQVEAMKSVDLRADIYSLGCTLFHLLSGTVPFDGNSAVSIMMKHVSAPPPVLKEVWPECPQVLSDVVGKMICKNPAERQQSYPELIEDLHRAYAAVENPEVAPVVEGEATGEPEIPDESEPTPAISQPTGTSAVAPPTEFAAPKKSKLPIFAGVAVLLLAVLGVGFVMFQKGGKSPALTNNANLPAYPQPGKWIDATEKVRARYMDKLIVEDGWMRTKEADQFATIIGKDERPLRNVVLRVIFRDGVGLALRRRITEQDRRYEGVIDQGGFAIQYHGPLGQGDILPWKKFSTPLAAGTEHEAVFVVQGDLLTLWLDGKQLALAEDSRIESGELGILFSRANPKRGTSQIRKIEYGELPGEMPKQAATGAAPASPQQTPDHAGDISKNGPPIAEGNNREPGYPEPEKWTDMTAGFRTRYLSKMVIEDGWFHSKAEDLIADVSDRNDKPLRSGALRVTFRDWVQLNLRRQISEGDRRYEASIGPAALKIRLYEHGKGEDLWLQRSLPAPLAAGTEHEAIFAAQGDLLTLWLDGRQIASVHNARIDSGTVAVRLKPDGAQEYGQIKKIEYGELPDAPVSAEMGGEWRDWVKERREAGRLAQSPDFTDDGEAVKFKRRGLAGWDSLFRDGDLRVTCVVPALTDDSKKVQFFVRRVQNGTESQRYSAVMDRDGVVFVKSDSSEHGHWSNLAHWPYPPGFDLSKPFTIEVRARGDRFTVLLNDLEVGSIRDSSIPGPGLCGVDGSDGTRVFKLEARSLDTAAKSEPAQASSSMPAAAGVSLSVNPSAAAAVEGDKPAKTPEFFMNDNAQVSVDLPPSLTGVSYFLQIEGRADEELKPFAGDARLGLGPFGEYFKIKNGCLVSGSKSPPLPYVIVGRRDGVDLFRVHVDGGRPTNPSSAQ